MAKQTKKTGEATSSGRRGKAEEPAPSRRQTETREASRPARGRSAASAREKAPDAPAAKVARSRKAAVEAVTAPVVEARKSTSRAAKSASRKAADLVPQAPSLPVAEIGEFAKNIGSQVLSAINTDVGRVMVAELLIHVAKSLTKAAANTEAGQDAKDAVLNAGARIGAVAANAGAQLMERGANAADAGADAAAGAAGSARDLAREVAQVAVGAVGGIVSDVASKAMKSRSQSKRPESAGASQTPSSNAGRTPAAPSFTGTPRPRPL